MLIGATYYFAHNKILLNEFLKNGYVYVCKLTCGNKIHDIATELKKKNYFNKKIIFTNDRKKTYNSRTQITEYRDKF